MITLLETRLCALVVVEMKCRATNTSYLKHVVELVNEKDFELSISSHSFKFNSKECECFFIFV